MHFPFAIGLPFQGGTVSFSGLDRGALVLRAAEELAFQRAGEPGVPEVLGGERQGIGAAQGQGAADRARRHCDVDFSNIERLVRDGLLKQTTVENSTRFQWTSSKQGFEPDAWIDQQIDAALWL